MHFHSAATRYQGGDILVMIEQSSAMVNAFGFMGEVFDNAVASARHLRTINPHTRAVFYGTDKGLHDIDLDAPLMAGDLRADSKPDIPATMRALAEQYPYANPCRPLHVLMLSAGGLGGSYSEAMNSMLELMQKPGAQVMIDLLLIPKGPKLFQQMASVAASKMLNGGTEIDPTKPAPNFYMMHGAEDIPVQIGNAINKRISPDNPQQFMLDLVCSIVGRGVCTPMSCPPTAKFTKQRKP